MLKFQIFPDGRAAGATPVSGSDFTTKDYVSGSFQSASYSSNDKKIYFYNKNNSASCFIDATDFIKDGMLSSASIESGNLVLTFNTDAGKEPISLSLEQIFDPDNYYDKDDVDLIISGLPKAIEAINFNNSLATVSNGTASLTEKDPIYLADSASLKASASIAKSNSTWITANSGTLHTHNNKAILDGITGTVTASWDGAVSSAHTHSNAALLNSLTNDKTGSWTNAASWVGSNSASLVASASAAKSASTWVTANSGNIAVATASVSSLNSVTASLISSASVAKSASQSAASISAKTGSYDALIGLPTVSASDNGKILRVVSGSWALEVPITVYSGQSAPDNSLGNNGDIYLQS